MNRDSNPYSASSVSDNESAEARRFAGRSVVVGLLAALTFSTGLMLFWFGSTGLIDLGQYGTIALGSLLLASAALVLAFRFYTLERRGYAVGLLVTALVFFVPIVLIALQEAGVITWFTVFAP